MTTFPLFICTCFTLACPVLSCAECDRSGCDALGQRAKQDGAGVAGLVAESSDVVFDGCQECPLGAARLKLWRADAPVATEADAQALVAAREPDVTVEISGHYRRALDAGDYLLCEGLSCISVNVTNETLTVNIKRREGSTGFFVASRDDTELEEEFGFDVSQP